MKKTLYVASLVVAFFAPAIITIVAETPTPAPPPPTPVMTGLQPSPQVTAAMYAGQIITQVNGVVSSLLEVLDKGVPAQNGQPAITAQDIQAALGPENVMKLRAMAGTLSAPAAPAVTATATPKGK